MQRMEFADWMNEDFRKMFWSGINVIDRGTSWLNDVVAKLGQLGREVVVAHREMAKNPELIQIASNLNVETY